jgi:hypothetical protein
MSWKKSVSEIGNITVGILEKQGKDIIQIKMFRDRLKSMQPIGIACPLKYLFV